MVEKKRNKIYYSWNDFNNDMMFLVNYVRTKYPDIKHLVALPRGGLTPGAYLSNHLGIELHYNFNFEHEPKETLIIDDIVDTGDTIKQINNYNDYTILSLWYKLGSKVVPDVHCKSCPSVIWVVFPWEPEDLETVKQNTFKKEEKIKLEGNKNECS